MTRSIAAAPVEEAVALPGGTPTGKRIMVVEDDPGLMTLYRILLNGRGYDILSAEDGGEAAETFEREGRKVDLLIVDVCLPRVGAVEMLGLMKRGGLLPSILICSGAVEYETELQLREAGAKWFLPKPFRNGQMIGEVERILQTESSGMS